MISWRAPCRDTTRAARRDAAQEMGHTTLRKGGTPPLFETPPPPSYGTHPRGGVRDFHTSLHGRCEKGPEFLRELQNCSESVASAPEQHSM